MVSSLGIFAWIIVRCLLCLAGFSGKRSPQAWYQNLSRHAALAVLFVCILNPFTLHQLGLECDLYIGITYLSLLPLLLWLQSLLLLLLSLKWSACLGLEFVCGGNYSAHNEAVRFQHLPEKRLGWCYIMILSCYNLVIIKFLLFGIYSFIVHFGWSIQFIKHLFIGKNYVEGFRCTTDLLWWTTGIIWLPVNLATQSWRRNILSLSIQSR